KSEDVSGGGALVCARALAPRHERAEKTRNPKPTAENPPGSTSRLRRPCSTLFAPVSMSRPLVPLLLAVLLLGCGKKQEEPSPDAGAAPPPPPPTITTVAWEAGARTKAMAEGRAVMERHQCARCHTVDDLAAPPRPLHCTGCHVFLKGL